MGERVQPDGITTIEPGTLVFYKGFLVKVRGRDCFGIGICDPDSGAYYGSPYFMRLCLAVPTQVEPSDRRTNDCLSSDSEDSISSDDLARMHAEMEIRTNIRDLCRARE